MDPVTLAYYGAVCGMLAIAMPRRATRMRRFAGGVVVGLVAAGALHYLRGLLGL
jgi:hypothetical protein